jgi:hypothetical protein
VTIDAAAGEVTERRLGGNRPGAEPAARGGAAGSARRVGTGSVDLVAQTYLDHDAGRTVNLDGY